ncbi:MAG: RNA polymerase sigma factor [candidate division Zixibacteria bacterium]|nr:RNA polymerase sigma factor [candidate division Zixibacteria bacterium]
MDIKTKDLVQNFIDGDQKAFAELVGRFKKRVYSVAFQMLGNHLDADEVTQEAFVRIYNRRNQLKNVDYFASFLMRIATNYAIDLIRWKQKGFVSIDVDKDTPGSSKIELVDKTDKPDQIIENKELLDSIKQAMKKLPPKQRVTVVLHDLEGFSKKEIAGILQCPQATVRSNLHIARTKLRKWLTKDDKGR